MQRPNDGVPNGMAGHGVRVVFEGRA
jgi:hypothetical protein